MPCINPTSRGCGQETELESSALQATFEQAMELLAAASEEYKEAGSDFVRALLHPDPSKRLTAQGALCHPFLSSSFPGIDPELMPAKLKKDSPAPKSTVSREFWKVCVDMCNTGWAMEVR